VRKVCICRRVNFKAKLVVQKISITTLAETFHSVDHLFALTMEAHRNAENEVRFR
jgi:hypothetical protein